MAHFREIRLTIIICEERLRDCFLPVPLFIFNIRAKESDGSYNHIA